MLSPNVPVYLFFVSFSVLPPRHYLISLNGSDLECLINAVKLVNCPIVNLVLSTDSIEY